MLFVDNRHHTDPKFNLALEEYLLRHYPSGDAFFLLYVNWPSVILGRNQNVYEEIDPDYLVAHDIELVRRLSGGGAVYHDGGNLNFSFIVPDKKGMHDYARFTAPVVRALARFGLTARLERTGALFIGDKKVSGHAQYATTKKLLSHGTLLFDAEMTHLRRSLKPPFNVTQSNAVASVRSSVVNLRDLLPTRLPTAVTLDNLRQVIREEAGADGAILHLSDDDWGQIGKLAQKYADWDWVNGRSPRCVIQNQQTLLAGEVEAQIEIKNGCIHSLDFYCDFFDYADPTELAARFIGVRYERGVLEEMITAVDFAPYFGEVATAVIMKLIFG